MKFLDGWKTKLGVIGGLASIVVPAVTQVISGNAALGQALVDTATQVVNHVGAVVTGASALLTLLGVVHKVEKKAAGQ